ncbi:MAG TPA: TolC family protein [Bryobacteraceae bacterium]|jgi:outer membrane protein TolC
MKQLQSPIAFFCALLMAMPSASFAQQQGTQTKRDDNAPRLDSEAPHWYSPFTQKYDPKIVPPIRTANSDRLEQLIRGGNLYLSLQDAIALALENNIDIEVQRYGFLIADQNLKAAQAGGGAGNVSTAVAAGAANAAGGAATGNGAGGGGGTVAVAGGTSIPNLDPVLTGNIGWAHNTTPQNNSITTGLTSAVNTNKTANFAISQGFLTGTNASLGYNNTNTEANAFLNNYNPTTSSNLDLQVTQHLLQGFGIAINTRNIRVAKNNIKVNDLTFQQQVISTVANVVNLYWNLVSYNANVDVAQKTIEYSQKLYEDNQKQVQIGTLAPVEVTRALAEVKADQKTLITAQTNVLQQEVILKNALSRNGVASPTIADAHIIPTDRIRIPDQEPVQIIADLVDTALQHRPDLAQTRIQLDNSKINLTGTRAAMLPTLDLVADTRNSALSGTVNELKNGQGLIPTHQTDAFFLGGYGNVLGQLFGRNFPTYSVAAQLNIPLRNRTAQANMAVAQLQLRQSELQLTKSISQVRVDVNNALIAVKNARASEDAALESVNLEEQLLDAEKKKLDAGTSFTLNVILVQRDLATAQIAEVQARSAYALAKVQLDQAIGTVLDDNNVIIDEAKSGKVSRGPSSIPDLPNNGGANGAVRQIR